MYGSLKNGFEHHGQLKGARYEGEACLAGYRLVLYEDSYPAICAEPGSFRSVPGEVFSIPEALLLELDAFEDAPDLYQRTLVKLSDGRNAWAYVIDSTRASRYPALEGPYRAGPSTGRLPPE